MARQRERAPGTILTHLEKIASHGGLRRTDLAHLAREDSPAIAEMHDAMREVGVDRLRPVFDRLGGRFTFDEIRVARLLLRAR